MSDPIQEAMEQSGLGEFINRDSTSDEGGGQSLEFSGIPSLGQQYAASHQTIRNTIVFPNNLIRNVATSGVVQNQQAPRVIRVASAPVAVGPQNPPNRHLHIPRMSTGGTPGMNILQPYPRLNSPSSIGNIRPIVQLPSGPNQIGSTPRIGILQSSQPLNCLPSTIRPVVHLSSGSNHNGIVLKLVPRNDSTSNIRQAAILTPGSLLPNNGTSQVTANINNRSLHISSSSNLHTNSFPTGSSSIPFLPVPNLRLNTSVASRPSIIPVNNTLNRNATTLNFARFRAPSIASNITQCIPINSDNLRTNNLGTVRRPESISVPPSNTGITLKGLIPVASKQIQNSPETGSNFPVTSQDLKPITSTIGENHTTNIVSPALPQSSAVFHSMSDDNSQDSRPSELPRHSRNNGEENRFMDALKDLFESNEMYLEDNGEQPKSEENSRGEERQSLEMLAGSGDNALLYRRDPTTTSIPPEIYVPQIGSNSHVNRTADVKNIRNDSFYGVPEHQATHPTSDAQMTKVTGVQNIMLGEKANNANILRIDHTRNKPRLPQKVVLLNNIQPGKNDPKTYTMSLLPPEIVKEDVPEEELGHAETFSEYKPAKLDLDCKHPDPVVESASLSSVEAPDVTYSLQLPTECIGSGALSAVQLESIIYACQKHRNFLPNGERAGFLIGDGAGVGKGRMISGIIFENFINKRKRALWLSVSNDLKVDAKRDLCDIGAKDIPVYSLNKFKYEKINSRVNGKVKSGVVFATYSSLIGESKVENKFKTRLQQLIKWLSKNPDSVIIFDECHKAKNLFSSAASKCTKTGKAVVELQEKLPMARVIYASATGASEPRNMGYMIRLGLWGRGTPFKTFNDFVQAVERRGVGAMEMIAMEMKQRGTYIARQLSFKGVSFGVVEVDLHWNFIETYNNSVLWWVSAREKFQQAAKLVNLNGTDMKKVWGQFWSAHQRFFKYLCISAKVEHCVGLTQRAIKLGKSVVIGLQSTGESRLLDLISKDDELDDFFSSAKGVLQKLVDSHFPCSQKNDPGGTSSSDTISRASSPKLNANNKRKLEDDSNWNRKKLKRDNDTDSESDSDDDSDDERVYDDDYSYLIFGSDEESKKRRDKKPKKEKKSKKKKVEQPSDDEDDKYMDILVNSIIKRRPEEQNVNSDVLAMKNFLLKGIEELGNDLPPNALDDLIDKLGGPSRVAEMTGRRGRLVQSEHTVKYEKRSDCDASLETINLKEKERFMNGTKLIAIISEAASSGISLQADRRVENQRKRMHITLELPWSADRAIQQFGRTHRSNQVSAPEYVFLISKLAGERRFASTVAKRLECLGALTQGDRRAAETRDLSQFNIDNKFGQTALVTVLKSIVGQEKPLVPPYDDDKKTEIFFQNVQNGLAGVGLLNKSSNSTYVIEKDSCNISKFLNRILGMNVETQNSLFDYFTLTLRHIILDAKKKGKWDLGILDIGSAGEEVTTVGHEEFTGNEFSGMKTLLNTVNVDRGLSWSRAQNHAHEGTGPDDGFYELKKNPSSAWRKMYILAVSTKGQKGEILFKIYKANSGLQPNLLSKQDLKDSYRKVPELSPDVNESWNLLYRISESQCIHKYEKGYCKHICEVGKRSRKYYVLSGSILSIWTNMEHVMSQSNAKESRMQIIRLRTSNQERIVGMLINHSIMESLITILKSRDKADD